MKILFKITILFIALGAYGQKHTLLNKTFETNVNTIAMLNLSATDVLIEESTDGKMHFSYELEFENYSKKSIKKQLADIKIEVSKFDNNIHLQTTNIVGDVIYAIDEKNGITVEDDFFGKSSKTNNEFKRKSKDSILKLINKTSRKELKDILKMFKTIDDDGKKKDINSKNVSIKRGAFIIKVPSYVKLNILAEQSKINFKMDVKNEVNITIKDGSLKAKHISNEHNNVEVNEGNIEIERISDGSYTFKNIRNGLVGSIENIAITAEFSKIEFGEIGKNVKIVDFNSELWLYNFTNDFNRFDIKAEYTKINLFYPQGDYSMDTYGHNTVHYMGESKITMQPNKKGEKFMMMQRKPSGKKPFAGKLYFDIVNGIIRSDDELLIINN